MSEPALAADRLYFLPLGGSGEIGMNLNLYAYGGKWLMVDCGMSFSEPSTPGIELLFPDPGFIEERRKDLLAIVLTHGHEDHIGALPYLWPELRVPLYATPFTAGLIRLKFEEWDLLEQVELNEIPLGGHAQIGPFDVTYLSLAHSIPEGNAVILDTPGGRVFHTGDWKLDDDPVIGQPATAERLTAIGNEGILALIGDSTNIFDRQASGSEGKLKESLAGLLADRSGRILVTTFASNVARLDTLGEIARRLGRRLGVLGRSLNRIISLARDQGYLSDFPPLLDPDELDDVPRDELMVIATGCQGEPRAALSRIASGEHRQLRLSAGDTVIFSSKIIPGNELAIGALMNALAAQDVEVVTEKRAFVHVSGHPGQPELEAMYGWLRPQMVIPVHGEIRHMKAHATFAKRLGVKQTLVPENGTLIELAPDGPAYIDRVEAGRLALDGAEIIAVDDQAIVDRRRMSYSGYVFCVLVLDGPDRLAAAPALSMPGVPAGESAELQEACIEAIEDGLDRPAEGDAARAEAVRILLRRAVRAYTGKKPVTEVVIRRLRGKRSKK